MHLDFWAFFERKSGSDSAVFFSLPQPQYFAKTGKAALCCLDTSIFFRFSFMSVVKLSSLYHFSKLQQSGKDLPSQVIGAVESEWS